MRRRNGLKKGILSLIASVQIIGLTTVCAEGKPESVIADINRMAFGIPAPELVGWGEYRNAGFVSYDLNNNWTGTTVYGIQFYSQKDERWANMNVGTGGRIAATGCVPTCAAMILSKLGYNKTPYEMAYMFNEWGHYNADYGHGTDTGVWREFCEAYNMTFQNEMTAEDIKTALAEGKLVVGILDIGKKWTHCCLFAGLDSDGYTTVYDPLGSIYREKVDDIYAKGSPDEEDHIDGGPFIAMGVE